MFVITEKFENVPVLDAIMSGSIVALMATVANNLKQQV